jgi:cyclase
MIGLAQPSRREFAATLAGALLRAGRARAQAPSYSGAPQLFDLRKVAEGVFAAIARPAAIINCNAAIFENEKDLLIVDSHSKPSAAASLVAQIRREVSSKPVRYIVNTHFHWDHVQGMPAYAKLAPGADVLSSSATRAVIAEQAVKRLAVSLEGSRAKLEQNRQALGAAKNQAERSYHERMVKELEAFLKEMQGWTPELPNLTFDNEMILHDRAHELHLVFKGRAHTGGDICVFCPQKKLIVTADVLSSFIPGMYDGYPLEWPQTLRRIGELAFEQVIPGHGDVQESKARLAQVLAYLEEIIATVRAQREQGKTIAQLQKAITAERLHTITETGYGAFVESSIARHMLIAPEARARDTMDNSIRTNIANIYNALGALPPKASHTTPQHSKEG